VLTEVTSALFGFRSLMVCEAGNVTCQRYTFNKRKHPQAVSLFATETITGYSKAVLQNERFRMFDFYFWKQVSIGVLSILVAQFLWLFFSRMMKL